MPTLTKKATKSVRAPKENKKVLVPEPMAHSINRKIRLTDDQLAKLQLALDDKLPLMMSIGLQAKLWGVVVEGSAKKAPLARTRAARAVGGVSIGYGDGEEDIVDEEVLPLDDGAEIPEDEEEEEEGPEAIFGKNGGKGSSSRGKLVGATIQYYAVAVFRPEFKKD
jgi:hypothetical protein